MPVLLTALEARGCNATRERRVKRRGHSIPLSRDKGVGPNFRCWSMASPARQNSEREGPPLIKRRAASAAAPAVRGAEGKQPWWWRKQAQLCVWCKPGTEKQKKNKKTNCWINYSKNLEITLRKNKCSSSSQVKHIHFDSPNSPFTERNYANLWWGSRYFTVLKKISQRIKRQASAHRCSAECVEIWWSWQKIHFKKDACKSV